MLALIVISNLKIKGFDKKKLKNKRSAHLEDNLVSYLEKNLEKQVLKETQCSSTKKRNAKAKYNRSQNPVDVMSC
ncbi:hypothetical protein Scep_011999 [Stephania cephalantha]|uniref:Uncharacterized protein n=1 Tax=Stephania cephalantha TaxID=152367 RepID=A0AAP0JE59_9MAGN